MTKIAIDEIGTALKTNFDGGAKAADRSARALNHSYRELADSLRTQTANLTANDREQFVATQVARLNVDATTRQKQAVTALAGQYFDTRKALSDFNGEAEFFGQTIYSAFDGLITGGQDATSVLLDLGKALERAVLQATLLGQGPLAALFGTAPNGNSSLGGVFGSIANLFRPATTSVAGSVASAITGGVGVSGGLGTLYHGGGVVGSLGPVRALPAGAWAVAPRFHSGLASNEFAAILQKGEHVLTAGMAARTEATVSGLSAAAVGSGDGAPVVVNISTPPGTTADVKQGDGHLDIVVRQLEGKLAASVAGNGQLGRTIQQTFDLKRKSR